MNSPGPAPYNLQVGEPVSRPIQILVSLTLGIRLSYHCMPKFFDRLCQVELCWVYGLGLFWDQLVSKGPPSSIELFSKKSYQSAAWALKSNAFRIPQAISTLSNIVQRSPSSCRDHISWCLGLGEFLARRSNPWLTKENPGCRTHSKHDCSYARGSFLILCRVWGTLDTWRAHFWRHLGDWPGQLARSRRTKFSRS